MVSRGMQKKTLLILLAFLALVAILAAGIAVWATWYNRAVYTTLTVEIGKDSLAMNDFIKEGYDDRGYTTLTDLATVNLSQLGKYRVDIAKGKHTIPCQVVVADTTPPTGVAVDTLLLKGAVLPSASTMVTDITDATKVTVIYGTAPDMATEGKQPVTVLLTDEGGNVTTLSVPVTVVADTTPPMLEGVKDLSVYIGGDIDYDKEVTVNDDYDKEPTLAIDSTAVNLQEKGTYPVTYTATDSSGNQTEQAITVTVKPDETAPTITGVKNLYVYVNGTLNYRKHVKVSDNFDKKPTLAVDSSAVDISKVGTYTVTYTATDAAGNQTVKTAKVVVSKRITSKEDKIAAANQMADKVMNSILKDGMTDRQKVTAIYNWARRTIVFYNHSDKSDYRVEAYNAFRNHYGDCFSYYSVTKMMFEKLGIPNIDIRKTPNFPGDSNHFWSLVSVDGGKTYYHFDSSPRTGPGDDFCLVTDAFLEAYSKAHKNCHNWDKSKYPATPTK